MVTADNVLAIAVGWLGRNEKDNSFIEILNVYNGHKPLARGYAMKLSDDWCDCFVSACAIKAGAVDLIGTEVGCGKHVEIFKQKGIWIEDGTVTPQKGDIILYNWNKNAQPNDSGASHIGFVLDVKNGRITAIEGNRNEKVDTRDIPVGWGYIRGFARPKYDKEEDEMPDFTKLTDQEVDALLSRIEKRLDAKPIDSYAVESSKKGVSSGMFSDGNDDGIIDSPQMFLKRQDAAVLLNRAGALEKK